MQKIIQYITTAAMLYLAVVLFISPGDSIGAASSAIDICLQSVIPALFPYLVCSGFLAASGFASMLSHHLSPLMRPLFGVPGSGAAALVLGTVSGYPVGAVCVRDLYLSGECNKSEAERLLAFCNNSGPVFIMSFIGCSIFSSPYIGRMLYISHVMSAVLTGIIFRSFFRHPHPTQQALPPASVTAKNALQALGSAIDSAVFTILKICGFVIFFTVFAASLPKGEYMNLVHPFLEITGGIRTLSAADISYELKLCLVSFFAAFSGISVLLQVAAVIHNTGLSIRPYIYGKTIQGVLSFILTKVLVSRIPQVTDVFTKNAAEASFPSPCGAMFSSIVMLCFGVIVLLLPVASVKLWRRLKN